MSKHNLVMSRAFAFNNGEPKSYAHGGGGHGGGGHHGGGHGGWGRRWGGWGGYWGGYPYPYYLDYPQDIYVVSDGDLLKPKPKKEESKKEEKSEATSAQKVVSNIPNWVAPLAIGVGATLLIVWAIKGNAPAVK